MRRESSTVVVVVGEVGDGLLAGLGRSPNVSVARAPAGADAPTAEQPAAVRPGWEAGAPALREAAPRRSTYVIRPDDPLAAGAAAWRARVGGAGAAGGGPLSRRGVGGPAGPGPPGCGPRAGLGGGGGGGRGSAS